MRDPREPNPNSEDKWLDKMLWEEEKRFEEETKAMDDNDAADQKFERDGNR